MSQQDAATAPVMARAVQFSDSSIEMIYLGYGVLRKLPTG
jgi:hypothetical protein